MTSSGLERSALSTFPPGTLVYRVSSVLRRNVREFGPKHLFDDSLDTCWNSDQGSPQSIELVFPQEITPTAILLRFQGGFVGQSCELHGALKSGAGGDLEWRLLHAFEPDDISAEQRIPIPGASAVHGLRIVFNKSSDLYGRVTIYRLDVLMAS